MGLFIPRHFWGMGPLGWFPFSFSWKISSSFPWKISFFSPGKSLFPWKVSSSFPWKISSFSWKNLFFSLENLLFLPLENQFLFLKILSWKISSFCEKSFPWKISFFSWKNLFFSPGKSLSFPEKILFFFPCLPPSVNLFSLLTNKLVIFFFPNIFSQLFQSKLFYFWEKIIKLC